MTLPLDDSLAIDSEQNATARAVEEAADGLETFSQLARSPFEFKGPSLAPCDEAPEISESHG